MIDSPTPYQFDLPDDLGFYSRWRRASALLPSLAGTPIGRLTLGAAFGGLPSRARREARFFASLPRQLQSDGSSFSGCLGSSTKRRR
jgi:hypothetical protein